MVPVVVPTPDVRPLISVCAWHTPKPELAALARQYPDQITHGLCDACLVRFEQGLTS